MAAGIFFSSPCGAGISVQHQGFNQQPVLIENCVFLRNRAQVTGAAIDLLAGSCALINNCLFVGNVSNIGEDVVAKQSGERPFVNSGVLTIFRNSRAIVRNCTINVPACYCTSGKLTMPYALTEDSRESRWILKTSWRCCDESRVRCRAVARAWPGTLSRSNRSRTL